MSGAKHATVEQKSDRPAEQPPQPETPQLIRLCRPLAVWVTTHRRESAALVVASMMGVLLLDTQPLPVEQTPAPNLDGITELFAELDAEYAAERSVEAASGDTNTSASSRAEPHDAAATARQDNQNSSMLRIPGPPTNNSASPDPFAAGGTAVNGSESRPEDSQIRFSGLLRPAE